MRYRVTPILNRGIMQKEKAKKIINITTKTLAWILVVFAVFMMIFTVISVSTVGKSDRGLFGYKFFIVKTDSMSLSEENADFPIHFSAGDLIIIQELEDKTALEPNDVISFISSNTDTYGEVVTHAIYEKVTRNGEVICYKTMGTHTGTPDENAVEPSYVLGKYVGQVNGLGHFLAFMKTVPGYIVCIFVPFLLLIIYNGVNCIRLFKKYKQEQNAEIQKEKVQIANERKQTEDLLKELQALKAELIAQKEQNEVQNTQKVEEKIEAEQNEQKEEASNATQTVETTENVEDETVDQNQNSKIAESVDENIQVAEEKTEQEIKAESVKDSANNQ